MRQCRLLYLTYLKNEAAGLKVEYSAGTDRNTHLTLYQQLMLLLSQLLCTYNHRFSEYLAHKTLQLSSHQIESQLIV